MKHIVFSDIHANAAAFDAMMADLRERAKPWLDGEARYWFLGDLMGYGPDPVEVLNEIQTIPGLIFIPGNHDEWILSENGADSKSAKQSLRFHKEQLENMPLQRGYTWYKEIVTQALEAERESADYGAVAQSENADTLLLFSHADVLPHTRRVTYLYPWEKEALRFRLAKLAAQFSDRYERVILFLGHTHVPMWAQYLDESVSFRPIRYDYPLDVPPGVHIINPGSVGQPRDGDNRSAYVIFDASQAKTRFIRTAYDVEKVVHRIERIGSYDWDIQQRLVKRLRETAFDFDLKSQLSRVYKRPMWELESSNSPNDSRYIE